MTIIAPHPFGTQIKQEQLIHWFGKATLWEDRYRQLILLARQFPSLPEQLKQPKIEIKGCENRVWLDYQQQDDGTFHFYGDSEGRIVKGLLAILLTSVEGLSAQQILATNPIELYEKLGIYQELSTSRGNGLQALIDRVNEIARSSLS